MNEHLSALMDGELDRTQAAKVITQLGANAEQRDCWETYHLMADVMRADTVDAQDLCAKRRQRANAIFAALADEPTVFAPSAVRPKSKVIGAIGTITGRSLSRGPRLAMAVAASIVTVSAVGIVAMKAQQDGVPEGGIKLIAQQAPAAVMTVAAPAVNVNDYLVLHRQFANTSGLKQATFSTKCNDKSSAVVC
jgi:sigma-E factor negative regulatory protein RseA